MDTRTIAILTFSIVISIASFVFAFWLYRWVKSQKVKNQEIIRIQQLISSGASTFLNKEYSLLVRFAGIIFLLILLFLPKPIWIGGPSRNVSMALSFVLGTGFSALAGKIGIIVATHANGRTAEAAQESISLAFLIGYRGGAVTGMAVVGASLLGVSLVYTITGDTSSLLGFSLGASLLALFAKAGGGIFTKTADISADLVGKVELGIPEDDPRNPAVIADNVGDNVGDVAGAGADLLDSNVASLVAAVVIALSITTGSIENNIRMIFVYASLGLFSSIMGVVNARMGKNGNPSHALSLSTYITVWVFIILTALSNLIFNFSWRIWGASIAGLMAGVLIGITSNYFTSDERQPVKNVAKLSVTGPAFTILSGISYGFMSVLPAMIGIAVASLVAYLLCNPLGEGYAIFGISMSAVGMLSIVGTIISNDAYGPIVDNARGLVEMGNLGEEALDRTDILDSAGNTVKAITKGFSIGAAGLTVISLLGAFITEVNSAAVESGIVSEGTTYLKGFDIMDPLVFFGLLIGAAIPAVFSAMLIMGVNRNAERMVAEIHRQFDEIPGLKEGNPGVSPEYDRCISIATTGALKELIPAGLVAIVATLLVGFIGGVRATGGFLAGNIVSGLLLAELMSNSGGLWDNAKKYIESGSHGGKGSDAHKSAVIGDTVGDPFKDTAGPSINTQITVVSLIASICSGLFLTFSLFG